MNRRKFLRNSALASTTLLVPSFLKGYRAERLFNSRSGKILVVVQLSGGNDGLNTFVPFRNDIYYQGRPRLAVEAQSVLRLNDELGLNPAMTSLRDIYEEGLVSVVNSVGYPNPDRSHFRSMDIWHTASDSDEYLSSGWIGRYIDNNCPGCEKPYHALEVDDSLSLALKGRERSGFAMSNPAQLKKTTSNPFLKAVGRHHQPEEEMAAYLYKTMVDTQESADYLHAQSKKHSSKAGYPGTPFGKDLRLIAELIMADTDTRIYYLSLSGFDTHANQKVVQERLLKQYADGMKAFVQDMEQHGLMDEVLIITFSEFGRRVKQNASNGTDHGTANNLVLIGKQLRKPGIYNAAPDLSRLDQGDLIYQVDFREVYAAILEGWLGASSRGVLGRAIQPLSILK